MKIIDVYSHLSKIDIKNHNGKYFADKSYGYDVVYFASKYLLKHNVNNKFNFYLQRETAKKYIAQIFGLDVEAGGVINYFLESLNLLEFTNVITKTSEGLYLIENLVLLEFITEKIENSFIFNYLLAYNVMSRNSDLENYYRKIIASTSKKQKEDNIRTFGYVLVGMFPEIGERQSDINTQWSKQNVKYTLNILNFINREGQITRELNIKKDISDIFTISLNVYGTRSNRNRVKKNDYISKFNYDYVYYKLNQFVIADIDIPNDYSYISPQAGYIADMYLDFEIVKEDLVGTNATQEQEIYLSSIVRNRNPRLQRIFREELLTEFRKSCALCGIAKEDLLVAAHIYPLAMCEDTYDGFNSQNGLLLCVNHDALFEKGRYITINENGNLLVKDELNDILNLVNIDKNTKLDSKYLSEERLKFLMQHNKLYKT